MKKIFALAFLLTLTVNAFAQARKAQPQRLSIASRDFTITNFGAVGDGQALTNCSILTGSDHVICQTGKFIASDVGKVFALYGAGLLRNGYPQPLAGTIAGYVSPNEAVLSVVAVRDVTNSERFVWGTNNTAAIQAAVDAAADAGGGEVEIPAGHYLTERVVLDCAAIGNFPGYGYSQPCIRAYNGISIRGNAALTTTLENWNPDLLLYNGLIDLGRAGEIPPSELPGASPFWPPNRLKNIEVSGLTLRQVKYPTRSIKVLYAYATDTVSVHDCYIFGYSYEGIYMGGGFKSVRWRVFNNVASEIGKGGPAYSNTTSAYNLNGSYVEAFNNKASNSGQCFEAGARHASFVNNICDNTTIAFNIGSTGSGIWDLTMSGNYIKNSFYAMNSGNGGGTLHDIRFLNNIMIDTPDVIWSYAANSNPVNEVEFDSIVHAQSEFSGNSFFFSRAYGAVPANLGRSVFRIFQNPSFLNVGSDTITVANNTVQYDYLPSGPLLIVGGLGGKLWTPSTAFADKAPVVSSLWSGFWYRATNAGTTGVVEPVWPTSIGDTVTDGTITWLCMGARPQVIFNNNTATLPANIADTGSPYGTWPSAIRIDAGSPGILKVNNFKINGVRWRRQAVGGFHEDIVPMDAPFDDFRRYTSYPDDVPVADFWQLGTYLQKRGIAADGVYGWMTIRTGYAAPAYSATASYSTFGTLVKPTADNGKVYQLISGSCTSTTEPTWPLTGTITNGGCTWKAAAPAAKFRSL